MEKQPVMFLTTCNNFGTNPAKMAQPNFLSAKWRNLIFANYEVDPKILQKHVPYRTELDSWNGQHFVSVVGFEFVETAVLGVKFPFHTNFEEINLRFYVRFKDGNSWHRGVVFVKEIVPRRMITFIANVFYKENYATHPTRKNTQLTNNQVVIKYEWLNKRRWNSLGVTAEATQQTILSGSEEEFITEHYWGYAKVGATRTSAYEVVHPKWHIYPVIDYQIDCDFVDLYGQEFGVLAAMKPNSVFLADGSEVAVLKGGRIL